MTKIFIAFISLFSAFYVSNVLANESRENLTFSYGPHNSPPYAITQKNEITSGIIVEIGKLLTKELRVNAKFISVSRKRQANQLLLGETDVILITNPKWLDNPERFIWSEPLFEEEDVLIGLADQPYKISRKEQLKDMTIGTILGYKYPTLDPMFKERSIIRQDVRSLNANIQKLTLKRIDLLVDSTLLIEYQFNQRGNRAQFQRQPFKLSQHHIHAAISKKASMPPEIIKAALKHLVENGSIETVLNNYR